MINKPSSLVSNMLRCALSGSTQEIFNLLESQTPSDEEKQTIATVLLSHAPLCTLLAIQDKHPNFAKEFEDAFCRQTTSSFGIPSSFSILLKTCNEKALQDCFAQFLKKREYISAMHTLEVLQHHKHHLPSFAPQHEELLSFASHRFVSAVIQKDDDFFKKSPWSNWATWVKQNDQWLVFLDKVKNEITRRQQNHISSEAEMALESIVTKLSLEHELYDKENVLLKDKAPPIKKM